MTSNPTHAFVSKDCEAVTLDHTTVYMYPKIVQAMSSAEKQYGLMVNKAALHAANVSAATKLQAFGQKTGSSALISIIQARCVDFANKYIVKAGNFSIVSYGRVITDATKTNGELKGTMNKSDANRRPEDLQFAKLSCNISFCDLDSNDLRIYPFSFFVHLKVESESVTRPGNAANIDLVTFHRDSDWATSTVKY